MMEQSLFYQLAWAWRFSKAYRFQLLLYFLLELGSLALGLLFVWWSKRAIDHATSGDMDNLKGTLYLAVAATLIGMLVRLYASWLNERTRSRMLIQLQKDILQSQMQTTWRAVKNWHTGDIVARINTDCQEVVQVIGGGAINAVVTVARIIAATGLLWWMDPMLALILLAICPLLGFSKLYFRRLRRLHRRLKQAESRLGNSIQENLRLRLSIRALNLEGIRWRKVESGQREVYQLKMGLLNFSVFSKGLMNIVVNVGFLVTFIWGVHELYLSAITFGTLSAFLQLVARIQGPVLVLMGLVPLFVRFRTAVERLDEVFYAEKEPSVKQKPLARIQRIAVQGLSFKYEDNEVLQNLDAVFQKGEPTAIMGGSGKGKTTFVRLLLRLLVPDKGGVILETGGGTVHLSLAHRTNFAYVPQGDKLFSGTVRDNLQVKDIEISEAEMWKALNIACAQFVRDLPEGLDTIVGESGYGLSEGQAQRIAVARALLLDSGIWLFDEVTSALDPETADRLGRQLLEAGKDRILIFVTHDPQLMQLCKQTIIIK